jgi:predicted MFS family arabinose efflux permease
MMAALFWLGLVNIFLRSSMGVMAPELAAELALTPTMLGLIASAFFLSYAIFQIPTGMLLDRFGPRIVISGLFILTVLGTLLFASATNSTVMLVSRVMMGLGCAGIFSGAFMLIGRFYPSDKFTVIGGTLNSFAMMGTFLATFPLAYLVTAIGWRESFYMIAIAVAFFVLLAAISIRNWPNDSVVEKVSGNKESFTQIFKGVGEVFRTPGVLGIATGGLSLSSGGTILGVWGGPYLNDVHGLSETGRGEVLLFMALAGVVAHYMFGRLARALDSLKLLVLGGTTMIIIIMVTFALWPTPPLWAVTVLFAALGLSCGFPTILLAHGRSLMPAHLIGRGMTTVNTGVMISIALMQIAVGAIIGATITDGAVGADVGYRMAFGFMALMAVVTWVFYSRVHDCPPSEQ